MAESPRTSRFLVPDWYAANLGRKFDSVEAALGAGRLSRVSPPLSRPRILRGLAIALVARDYEQVGLIWKEHGTLTFLALEALRGRRRTTLLEFLPRPQPTGPIRRALYRLWIRGPERLITARSAATIQVMTTDEAAHLSERLKIPPERFRLVRWAFLREARALPDPTPESAHIVSSGRASHDWPTLFEAARGTGWEMIVICGRPELEEVRELAAGTPTRVLCEIPRDQHDALVQEAGIYVLCLPESGPSSGHLRIMAATQSGAPVIVSDVAGISGYVEADETALVVPPADPVALKGAIQRLIDDPALGARLAEAAHARGLGRTYLDYFNEVRKLFSAERSDAA